jgi:hypothetical protein
MNAGIEETFSYHPIDTYSVYTYNVKSQQISKEVHHAKHYYIAGRRIA